MKTRAMTGIILFVLLAVVLSLCFGSTELAWADLFAAAAQKGAESTAFRVFSYVRIPRTLGAVLCGSALAVAGTILQALLNNSLAGPNIIGINAGANFSALLVMAFFPQAVNCVAPAAFIGALACTALIYFIANATGTSRTTIVLAGVAISGIIGAASSCVKILFPDILYSYNLFSVGSLNGVTMRRILPALPYVLGGLVLAFGMSGSMNVLVLGEELSQAVGLNLRRMRVVFIFLAALLAGAAVSVGGTIGFVGLLVPHLARQLLGDDHRRLLPASAMLGASLVLVCDVLGRVLFAPFEIPVGILLAIFGGAYFMGLLLHNKGGRIYD